MAAFPCVHVGRGVPVGVAEGSVAGGRAIPILAQQKASTTVAWTAARFPARAPVGVAALLAGLAGAGGRVSRTRDPQRMTSRPRALAGRRAVESEAARLEREAAKLRAEAQDLEKANAVERRAARAEQLLGADRGSGATVGSELLAARMKDVVGLEMSSTEVGELLSASAAGKAELGFDDLASAAFDQAVAALVAAQDARLSEELARRERELAEEEERKRLVSSVTDVFSGGEEDAGPVVRVLACLPYLLPLVDGLPLGASLQFALPVLAQFIGFVFPLLALKEAIPFGTFIFLIGFQFLCRNPELPALVRYNLRQACVIDIVILLPQLLASFTGIVLPLDVPLFILMLLSVGYSLAVTALGKTPSGLGFISDATERGL